jgi:transcription antitermination factor NusG
MGGFVGGWPQDAAGSWFVIRTRSRQEKILARELRDRAIGCFLPLVTVTRVYGGRSARVETPLFPGILFLRGSLDDANVANQTNRVAQIIHVPDQQQVDQELHNLYTAMSSEGPFSSYPYLRTGVRVRVREGPLRGLEGVIEDVNHRNRIIFQVEALGQAASMEIDPALLDVIEK